MSVWPIICGQDCVLCTFVNETCMWMWMNIFVVRICLLWAFPIIVTVSRSISSYFAQIYPFSIYRNLSAVIRFRLSCLPIPTEQKIMRVKTVRGFFRPFSPLVSRLKEVEKCWKLWTVAATIEPARRSNAYCTTDS
jgi:hypothetical protein